MRISSKILQMNPGTVTRVPFKMRAISGPERIIARPPVSSATRGPSSSALEQKIVYLNNWEEDKTPPRRRRPADRDHCAA